jgi:hypothetical protein
MLSGMSEEKTRDIEEKFQTEPTLETVVKMIAALSTRMDQRFDALDVRLDRMDGFAHKTYSELVNLRADFHELKGQLKEHLPALK